MLIQQYLDRLFLELRLPEEEARVLREEMEAHLRRRAQDYVLKGHSEEDAARLAVAGFGRPAAVGSRIMRATPADRWALLRHRLGDAITVLALPAAVGLAYYLPTLTWDPRDFPGPFTHGLTMMLASGLALAGTLALYLPGWHRRRRRGLVPAFNPPALVYLLAAVLMAPRGLAFYVPAVADMYSWLPADLHIISLHVAHSPVPGILLGVAIGEAVRFKQHPGTASQREGETVRQWHQCLWYLAGVLLFWLFVFAFYRYGPVLKACAGSFSRELLLEPVGSILMLCAAVSLGIPRLAGAFRHRRATVFDRTKFLFFLIPGLLILFSYALYFWVPIYAVKQAFGVLFAYFALHRWTVLGAPMIGLGLWMSVRTTGDAY
ncbi:MAG: permease prefix domain 1-containing protein [Thermoanaerobacterales bacterium]|nr:permease prefix domain 1-containing protein [Thermoanaerobacterales bacterium]